MEELSVLFPCLHYLHVFISTSEVGNWAEYSWFGRSWNFITYLLFFFISGGDHPIHNESSDIVMPPKNINSVIDKYCPLVLCAMFEKVFAFLFIGLSPDLSGYTNLKQTYLMFLPRDNRYLCFTFILLSIVVLSVKLRHVFVHLMGFYSEYAMPMRLLIYNVTYTQVW